jgi:large subunit ribosomal protein L2
MAIKRLPSVTPGRRHASKLGDSGITKKEPEKTLTKPINKTGGRGMYGHITTRHQGGGHKRLYRKVDFVRDKRNIPAKVAAIEYDPNRSVNLALIHYRDGEKRYILAPQGLRPGDEVIANDRTEVEPGNAMLLKNVPLGTFVCNIELVPGKGGQIARSAGCFAIVAAREGRYVHLRLPSLETRRVHGNCLATIGQLGNEDRKSVSLGKAGRKRWLGVRPTVRGVAQHPGSHPHGGGEGRSGVGMSSPKSPWGKRTLGKKTRKKKVSDKFIVKGRKRGK